MKGMKGKGRSAKFVIPSEMGGSGIPPKMKTQRPPAGISSPSEFGQRGKPVHRRPSFKSDPRLD